MICDGTSIVCVTRSRATVSMNALGVERAMHTYVAPSMNAGSIVTIAPLNTSEPACSTTDSGVIRHALAISVAYIARMKCVCTMPFGSPVVPLVYMMVITSSALTGVTGRSPRRGAAQRAEVASAPVRDARPTPSANSSVGAPGVPARTASSIARRSAGPTSTFGVASATSAATPGALSSGDIGTTAAPSFAHAQ